MLIEVKTGFEKIISVTRRVFYFRYVTLFWEEGKSIYEFTQLFKIYLRENYDGIRIDIKIFRKASRRNKMKEKKSQIYRYHNYVITTSNEWIIPFSLQRELLNPRRVLY